MLYVPPAPWPQGSRCSSSIWVLKPGARGISGDFITDGEGQRQKGRGAGFSSRFLCPENRFGRKEAIPALAGEAAPGLPPPPPSLQLQPGLQIHESKARLLGGRFPISGIF